ncbi:hypothetical protein DL768_005364 [Monosporascus sp. mg162]|nr:hypothetical protein DL768_005364 [Monosporascus sp. mg162]
MGLSYLSTPYAPTVSQAFLDILWDPAAGAFFDSNGVGSGCRAQAQDGNSLAILAGIANITYAKSAPPIRPTRALFRTAMPFTLRAVHRTYGWMSTNDPGITSWEGYRLGGLEVPGSVHASGVRLVDRCRAATEHPRPRRQAAQARVQGVDRQADAGGRAVGKGGDPDSLRALKVSWERIGAHGDMEVHVHSPEDTNGTVSVPAAPDDAEERGALLNGIAGIAEMATGSYIDFGGGEGGGEEHVVGFPNPRTRREGCGWKARGGGRIRRPGSGPEALMAAWK